MNLLNKFDQTIKDQSTDRQWERHKDMVKEEVGNIEDFAMRNFAETMQRVGKAAQNLSERLTNEDRPMEYKVGQLGEIWRKIEDFDGYYEVSNHGRVRSYHKSSHGRRKNPKILNPTINTGGYYSLQLSLNNAYKECRVHKLVAEAFIPNPDNKEQVNHKSGDKLNNYVTNLEWVTASENMKHAFKNGLNCNKGEGNSRHKLTENDVLEIREMYKNGSYTYAEIAEKYPVCERSIGDIINRKSWKHL